MFRLATASVVYYGTMLPFGVAYGRCHPELRFSLVADDVDVRWLVAVGGVREHSVWTIPQEGGQWGSRARLEWVGSWESAQGPGMDEWDRRLRLT